MDINLKAEREKLAVKGIYKTEVEIAKAIGMFMIFKSQFTGNPLNIILKYKLQPGEKMADMRFYNGKT